MRKWYLMVTFRSYFDVLCLENTSLSGIPIYVCMMTKVWRGFVRTT
jgi:hypothetical protein